MIKGEALNSKLIDVKLVTFLTYHCLLIIVIKLGLG